MGFWDDVFFSSHSNKIEGATNPQEWNGKEKERRKI